MTTKGAYAADMIAAALKGDATGHIAALGVGDSNAAESTAHTDLQAATNKLRKATTPTVSGGTVTCGPVVFEDGEAQYDWAELGVFNATTGGIMLLRSINGGVSLGTKGAGEVWDLTVTVPVS